MRTNRTAYPLGHRPQTRRWTRPATWIRRRARTAPEHCPVTLTIQPGDVVELAAFADPQWSLKDILAHYPTGWAERGMPDPGAARLAR